MALFTPIRPLGPRHTTLLTLHPVIILYKMMPFLLLLFPASPANPYFLARIWGYVLPLSPTMLDAGSIESIDLATPFTDKLLVATTIRCVPPVIIPSVLDAGSAVIDSAASFAEKLLVAATIHRVRPTPSVNAEEARYLIEHDSPFTIALGICAPLV